MIQLSNLLEHWASSANATVTIHIQSLSPASQRGKRKNVHHSGNSTTLPVSEQSCETRRDTITSRVNKYSSPMNRSNAVQGPHRRVPMNLQSSADIFSWDHKARLLGFHSMRCSVRVIQHMGFQQSLARILKFSICKVQHAILPAQGRGRVSECSERDWRRHSSFFVPGPRTLWWPSPRTCPWCTAASPQSRCWPASVETPAVNTPR